MGNPRATASSELSGGTGREDATLAARPTGNPGSAAELDEEEEEEELEQLDALSSRP